jgi:Family of unknown function (DUF5723)
MNSLNEKRHYIGMMIVFALGAVMTNTSYAGNDRVSGRTIGMARTFTASSRGLDALGLNPANLALDDRGSTVTFEFVPFGFRAGSDFINYQIYQDYFTGVDSLDVNGQPWVDQNGKTKRIPKTLSQSDKDAILGLFPGGIAHTQFNFDVTEFGFTFQSATIGGIGFSVSERLGVNLDIPEGYLKMLLEGFPEEGATYSLDNTSVTASWLREFNLSYARVLPFELKWAKNISVGIGVKYIQGFGYFGTDHYRGNIQSVVYRTGQVVDSIPLSGNFDFLQYQSHIPDSNYVSNIMKPAGTGLGFDFGLSAELFQAFRVGLSITDIGKVTWDQNNQAIVGTGQFAVSDFNSQDSVKNAFKGEKRDTTSFTSSLPTALHIGASLQLDQAAFITYFPGQLLLAVDLHFGFNEEPGNTKIPRFALGAEYRPINAIPIRTGISIGGRERFQWSLGLGINTPVWDLDFATESIALLTSPNSFRNGSFTLGMRFRI